METDPVRREFEEALALLKAVAEDTQRAAIDVIFADLQSAECSVVVVGEFNRGKSTLVNAFLGQSLLPCDVVPTTAQIHKIRYNPTAVLRVHGPTGRLEEEPMTSRQLREFVAGSNLVGEGVDFLELGLPLPQLEGFCIIDTPGVNDLNSHRCEVTYSFVPRADAVVFLLDARSPIRRSEIDFLQSCVTKSAIDRVIFVANFIDDLEPDELEHLKLYIANRLRTALDGDGFSLIFMSARQELAAIQDVGIFSENASGISQLRAELTRLREVGSMATSRTLQFAHRGYAIGRSVANSLKAREATALASLEGLNRALADLNKFAKSEEQRERTVSYYFSDRRLEILAMTRKSLEKFAESLGAKVYQMIESYSGQQFHELIGTTVPAVIRRDLKSWIDLHAPSIRKLAQELERNICVALSKSYQTETTFYRRTGTLNLGHADVKIPEITAEDLSLINVKAGLLGGGAATMLLLVGLGPLAPIIGMAGVPLVTKLWREKKLKDAKAKALEDVAAALTKCLEEFSSLILATVNKELESMSVAVQERLKQLVADASTVIREEIASRTTSQAEDAAQLEKIRADMKQAEEATERMLGIAKIKSQQEQAA